MSSVFFELPAQRTVQSLVVLLRVLAQLLQLGRRRYHALLDDEHPGHDRREDDRVVIHNRVDIREVLLVPVDPPVQVAEARNHLRERQVLRHRSLGRICARLKAFGF